MTARTRAAADQLALDLGEPVAETPSDARAAPWSAPMLPGGGHAPFDDELWFFEPWWPGVSATLVVDGGRVLLVAEQLTDPLPAFPELANLDHHVRARQAVIPGTLLVLDAEGRPDPGAVRRRLLDSADRTGTGAFIAADLLARDGQTLTDAPFADRRQGLLEIVAGGDRFLASRGVHGDGVTLATAASAMGIEGISARRLDAAWRPGVAPEAWLRMPVTGTPTRPVRPLLVLLQRLPFD